MGHESSVPEWAEGVIYRKCRRPAKAVAALSSGQPPFQSERINAYSTSSALMVRT